MNPYSLARSLNCIWGEALLKAIVKGGRPVSGGMQLRGRAWVLDATGEPIKADEEYSTVEP